MFAHIRFGSRKSVLPRELENNLAYSSNLVGAWRLSIYILFISICLLIRGERESEKVSVKVESLREKIEFGRRVWAEDPLYFVSVDEC